MSIDDIGNRLGSELSLAESYAVTSFFSIALYNVVELTLILFVRFRRRGGLYFWSFFIATWGIALYSIGFILKDFNLANSISYVYASLMFLGWSSMVTGQSMVLHSRLHLIVQNHLTLRLILCMIIVNAVILHIPAGVLCYLANSPVFPRFVVPFAVYERVHVSVFFVQESVISALYLYETCKLLRSELVIGDMHRGACRRLLLHLIYMSAIVMLLDIGILLLEYTGRYTSQTATKGFVYSVKLKLEFSVLNRLVEFVQRSSHLSPDLTGPRDGWNIRGEWQRSGGHLHPRMCCSWFRYASQAQHEHGFSIGGYVMRAMHITLKSSIAGEPTEPGSVAAAPGLTVHHTVNGAANG
ncbi:conserved hypothetical protein [Aspergillus terreus NIH2624]|uniref:DUF7703 domain-containing protein n=1 Tax=Aspergillus terreus (strain NIH 2624 / FGSC A1156) TaxID=341663 RepID=Q0CRT5_ASPTN|nr:uncharacterized protein ATEG_03599 [Aspergillus terreus NIH2624]EAU35401.1 conserved hypothetical protein [Aspergillus terreus NIH2624]